MEVKTKYNIHDFVTIKHNLKKETKCPICEGEKKIIIKNHKFFCPECYGVGTIEIECTKIEQVQITDIYTHTRNTPYGEKTNITYVSDFTDWDKDDYYKFYEEDIIK